MVTAVDSAKYYVLQVITGCELDVAKELNRRGVSAIIPLENRAIRTKGKWTTKPYVIFPGYVFINIKYSWSQYYIMSGIKGVVRLLGGGHSPEPLSKQETDLLIRQADMFREPSTVSLFDGGYKIVSGVLLMLKDNIKKIDRHAHRAIIEMSIAGKKTEFRLSFVTAE